MKFCISINGLKESEIHDIDEYEVSELLSRVMNRIAFFVPTKMKHDAHYYTITDHIGNIVYNLNNSDPLKLNFNGKCYEIKLESER